MAPNIIGSSFILAEAALNSDDANNNNNSTCKNRKQNSLVCNEDSTIPNTNDRVPGLGDQIVEKDYGNAAIATTTATPTTTANIVATEKPKKEYRLEIVWRNVVIFAILHMFGLYGLYLIFAENAYLAYCFGYVFGTFGGFGITAGAHRLWSHRAYKAKWPMRVFLMICQSIAFQNSIYEWVRDHRVHHKFTDTNADPHNSKRGFFFSHMGWLMCKKHPDVREKGKQIDMSDLEADPIVMFQKKYYFYIMPLCCFILPSLIPYFYLGFSIKVCFFTCSMLRYVLSLHYTWLVNSAAHFYGMKPYDNFISSTNNKIVSILAYGEGWHNYHHVFPWDYKAAELGTYTYNWSTALINFFAKLGLAYDLKTVSDDMIRKRVLRTGDGSHIYSSNDLNNNGMPSEELVLQLNHDNEENLVWGWDDADMRKDDREGANIIKKQD